MNFVPCIRWSGGKRKQSEDIVGRMPSQMGTFWIPFLGGGSVMFQLINSNIKYERIVASDIYRPLMDIWQYIQEDPQTLLDSYEEHYGKFSLNPEYYYQVVDEFNKQDEDCKDAFIFHFLTRSCMRGSIEFDKYGNFITKCQSGSRDNDGVIKPDALKPIVYRWNEAIQEVEFRCESYDKMMGHVKQEDYCFFDPPYVDGTWYHDNNIDMGAFYAFLRLLPCDYSITLNGDKDIYPIPEDLYTLHEYIYYGVTKTAGSRDSLWMRHKTGIYDSNIKNLRENSKGSGGIIPRNTDMKLMMEIQNGINILDQKMDRIIKLLEVK